jgi:aryl-alcohol dehydrogenase-like predicted oxidoreductase
VQEVYKTGVSSRFGLSNFQGSTVQEVYDYCKENGHVLPSVYQGNYNAVARKQQTLLFSLLRKLHIAFYAYSPIAGGFLTKTKQLITEGAGRFKKDTPVGQMYAGMYSKPAYLEELEP